MLPKLYLNHVFVVVGSEIFNALKNSSYFMNTFANVEFKRNSAKGLGEWEALYVRGKNTYIEIFEEFRGHKVGDYGFGFGTESKGDLDKFYLALKSSYPKITKGEFIQSITEQTTVKNTKTEFKCFDYLLFSNICSDNSGRCISPWLMEYTEETFEIRDSIGQYEKDNVSRARYNSKNWNPHAQLLDVTSLAVALEPEIIDIFANIMQTLLGGNSKRSKGSDDPLFVGADFKLELRSKSPQLLNFTIEMALTKPITAEETHIFDNAKLTLKENRAILSFVKK